jgi:hypothetical protein
VRLLGVGGGITWSEKRGSGSLRPTNALCGTPFNMRRMDGTEIQRLSDEASRNLRGNTKGNRMEQQSVSVSVCVVYGLELIASWSSKLYYVLSLFARAQT